MKTLTTKIFLLLALTFISSAIHATDNFMAPPDNDRIENAIDLNYGPLPYNETNVNFPEATFTVDGSSVGCGQVVAGIWYKFYATKNGNVSAFIQTNNGAIVTFYMALNGSVTNANQLNYVDQPSNICAFGNLSEIDAIAGTYYYIYMRNIEISTVAINVAAALAPPQNDHIINASEVAVNNPTTNYDDIHFLMATNSMDYGQVGCDTEDVPGVWYKFYTEVMMDISAAMSSNQNTSAIIFYKSLYEGDAQNGTDLEHVVQSQNQCGIQNSASITTEAENWYYIFASTLEPYADISVESVILGISENQLEGFSFYPNPVTNKISLSAKAQIDEVNIFNLLGQKVYAENPNASLRSIDLSFLQTGLYVMRVSSEGKTASYKIVKN